MKRTLTLIAVMALMAVVPAQMAQSQARTKTMTVSPDEASIIPGISALIRLKDSALVVEMVPAPDQRSEQFKDVDLKTGDRILMCNGQRVSTCRELNSIIDSVKIGESIKLGIQRGSAMLMASLEKTEMAGGKVMISTIDGPNQKVVSFGGGGDESTVLVLDGGLIVGRQEGSPEPVVIAVMPDAAEKLEGDMPQEGDVIVAINGNIDTNMSAFEEWYNSVPVGRAVTVEFKRDGETMRCTYTKSKLKRGSMMIEQ